MGLYDAKSGGFAVWGIMIPLRRQETLKGSPMDTPELDQTPAPTLTERGRELIERVEALDDMPILTKIKEVTALKRDAMAWAVDMAEAIERVTPYLDEQGT